EQINKYENIEETLKATLITAQTAAEDTCSAANKKAKIIVEEAELRSRQIIEQSNNRVIEIRKEHDSLVKEFKIFRNKFKSLLEDEIRSVDDIFCEIDESTIDRMGDLQKELSDALE
ncbi:MAG: DivIVA domain-containing protein, partial [Paraclostridium sp.]